MTGSFTTSSKISFLIITLLEKSKDMPNRYTQFMTFALAIGKAEIDSSLRFHRIKVEAAFFVNYDTVLCRCECFYFALKHYSVAQFEYRSSSLNAMVSRIFQCDEKLARTHSHNLETVEGKPQIVRIPQSSQSSAQDAITQDPNKDCSS